MQRWCWLLYALPDFIHLVVRNTSVFSLIQENRDGDTIISPWCNRFRENFRLREFVASTTNTALILPPPLSIPTHTLFLHWRQHSQPAGAVDRARHWRSQHGGTGSISMVPLPVERRPHFKAPRYLPPPPRHCRPWPCHRRARASGPGRWLSPVTV